MTISNTVVSINLKVLLAGVVIYVLWASVTQKVISIASISVPQVLIANGYTSDVAAERLQSAINDIVTRAHQVKEVPDVLMDDLPSIAVPGATPGIVVPGTPFSTEYLAAQIRRFFHIDRHSDVSGEITIAQKTLWLRLRMNGQDIYASAAGCDLEKPDDLFPEAAQKLLERADSYVLAAALSESDPGKSLEIAKRIIAERLESDPSVSWAHNLIGNNLRDQHKVYEAIAEYSKALYLNPRLAYPHNGLGNALRDQGKTDEAISEYHKAIEIDPGIAYPHNGLGNTLLNQHEIDEAIDEYRKAIDLAPRVAYPHYNLGLALRDQGKTDEAIAEYRKAIDLDPRSASAHNNLGYALYEQHETDEAIAEYRKAIELAPSDAVAHRNLSIALRQQGNNDAADAEEKKAIALEGNH